jgi:hypothetical protein
MALFTSEIVSGKIRSVMVVSIMIAAFAYALILCAPAANSAGPRNASNNARIDIFTGHYQMRGRDNTVDVQLLPGHKLQLHLLGYWYNGTAGPNTSVHTGDTESIIPLEGNVATYTRSEEGHHCKVTFTFFADKVIVKQEQDDECACGYGANVNVSGVYTKRSKKPQW